MFHLLAVECSMKALLNFLAITIPQFLIINGDAEVTDSKSTSIAPKEITKVVYILLSLPRAAKLALVKVDLETRCLLECINKQIYIVGFV